MSQSFKVIPGTKDLLPPESTHWQNVEQTIREHLAHYAYDEIRTPILENTNLFVRSIGTETGVVQKEMYTFDDKGGDSVTMRPEGTASVVRSYIENNLARQD
ncbi:MAG: Histidyl-tRNA synthetase, partial [uncultured bacterium]